MSTLLIYGFQKHVKCEINRLNVKESCGNLSFDSKIDRIMTFKLNLY